MMMITLKLAAMTDDPTFYLIMATDKDTFITPRVLTLVLVLLESVSGGRNGDVPAPAYEICFGKKSTVKIKKRTKKKRRRRGIWLY